MSEHSTDSIPPELSENGPTLADQLRELRRIGPIEGLNRLIDGIASWLGLWEITWSRSREAFNTHYLEYMRVRIGYALAQPLDRTFWKHCYEIEYEAWCLDEGMGWCHISSGSGWAMYGIDLTYRQRLRIIEGMRDFHRREREEPETIQYF